MDEIIEFDGAYSELFYSYIRYKRALGYVISIYYQYPLRDLSRQLAGAPASPDIIDKELCERYIARKDVETVATQRRRMTLIRQFALWLTNAGYTPYILPENLVKHSTEFVPYIISEKEMTATLAAADASSLAWVRLGLRILWCTGLRTGELSKLTLSDVDLDNATLLIRCSKGNRTRIVAMSDTLTEYVSRYLYDSDLLKADSALPLMLTKKGGFQSVCNIGKAIRKAFTIAGVFIDGTQPPRPHDIRHSYAVHALEKMVDSGMDIYCTLPFLAAYMGHADIKSTEYYLRFTAESHRRIIDTQEDVSQAVFGGE